MTFQREERYTVLKITDVGQALDADECEALIHYEQKVAAWRENNGKRPLVAVVVESDWPEYEPTWAAIEQRMTGRALPSLAELERDAGRYRWLRDNPSDEGVLAVKVRYWSEEYDSQARVDLLDATELDAAIDAARANEAKPKNDAFDTLPDDYETGDY